MSSAFHPSAQLRQSVPVEALSTMSDEELHRRFLAACATDPKLRRKYKDYLAAWRERLSQMQGKRFSARD